MFETGLSELSGKRSNSSGAEGRSDRGGAEQEGRCDPGEVISNTNILLAARRFYLFKKLKLDRFVKHFVSSFKWIFRHRSVHLCSIFSLFQALLLPRGVRLIDPPAPLISLRLSLQEAHAMQEKISAQYRNEIDMAKAQRDYELKKAAYDIEVNTKKAESEMAYQLQVCSSSAQTNPVFMRKYSLSKEIINIIYISGIIDLFMLFTLRLFC